MHNELNERRRGALKERFEGLHHETDLMVGVIDGVRESLLEKFFQVGLDFVSQFSDAGFDFASAKGEVQESDIA